MRLRQVVLLLFWLLAGTALGGCGPEAGRPRGGDRGADIGNRPAEVRPPSKFYSMTAPEANIYNVLCYPAQGDATGCSCDYDLSLIGGPSGEWSVDEKTATLTFFDALSGPPSLVNYCQKGDTLELTGKDGARLFNQFGLRTLRFSRPTCHDGVQSKSIGELGVDCGGQCNPELPVDMAPAGCPASCDDGVQSGLEEGVDCGGTCPEVCACHNGAQDVWEEGVDCGGPCKNPCACFDGVSSHGEDAIDCGGVCTKPCP